MRRHDYQAKTVVEFGSDVGKTLDSDDVAELNDDMSQRHARTQADARITIETNEHEREGIIESWGLNHPTMLFQNGQRAFISPADDADDLRLLFKESYVDGTYTPHFKFPIEDARVEIYWHRTPTCPVCGNNMTYGMVGWDVHERYDGHMSGWLCQEHIPATIEEGLR